MVSLTLKSRKLNLETCQAKHPKVVQKVPQIKKAEKKILKAERDSTCKTLRISTFLKVFVFRKRDSNEMDL